MAKFKDYRLTPDEVADIASALAYQAMHLTTAADELEQEDPMDIPSEVRKARVENLRAQAQRRYALLMRL